MSDPKRIEKILNSAKSLAREYRALTGKPLGITGEVAEFTAAKLLGLKLMKARTEGHDGIWRNKKVQIKGRCLQKGKPQGMLGTIHPEKDWKSVLLVLLNEDLDPLWIYEAEKPVISKALKRPGSKARNERGALSISVFRQIGKLVWRKD